MAIANERRIICKGERGESSRRIKPSNGRLRKEAPPRRQGKARQGKARLIGGAALPSVSVILRDKVARLDRCEDDGGRASSASLALVRSRSRDGEPRRQRRRRERISEILFQIRAALPRKHLSGIARLCPCRVYVSLNEGSPIYRYE